MSLVENQLYHFYNQGNNREAIFFSRKNQLSFLEKFRKYVAPYCDTLAYCLMPNHFHFLLHSIPESVNTVKIGQLEMPVLNNGFRMLLSSYAQAINKQNKRKGSLFRQKTKWKALEVGNTNYPLICFHYIHQNPVSAGLVKRMEEWEFSSFKDYAGIRDGNLCNKALAFDVLDLSWERFYKESYETILFESITGLF